MRDSLRLLLECEGFEAREFASCREFLGAARGDGDDCLIVDLHMPEMSGIELLEGMRWRGDMLPVILITGHLDAMIQERARVADALVVVEKPYKAAEILDLVRRAAGGMERPLAGRQPEAIEFGRSAAVQVKHGRSKA